MSKRSEEMHELFCREYIIDYNGTQAAIRAGYSEKTAYSQANRLLKNAEILSRVRELQAEQVNRLAVTADSVVLRLLEVYERCMQAKPVMTWDKEAKEYVATGEYVFDSKGALGALDLLGKHLAMFTNKTVVSGVESEQSKLDALIAQTMGDDAK